MKRIIYLFTFSMIVLFASSSCNNDDGPADDVNCTGLWATELEAELNIWTEAAVKYSTNPTTENCNAYKAAATAYINALEPYGDCSSLTGTERTQWEEAIADAQASINALDCN